VKIATWNVNGLRARLPAVVDWLNTRKADVVCLQETKVSDEDFPLKEIEAFGYRVAMHGQKGFNGVAILSREPQAEVARGFPGDPIPEQARVIAATVSGIRVIGIYVPNGSEVGSDKYAIKLSWLDRFREAIAETLDPAQPILICGDFNVAPEDRDVYKPERWRGKVLCSDPERKRFRALLDWGLRDALRVLHEGGGIYTWWDYRLMAFPRDWGLRIDHALVSAPLVERLHEVTVDREERGRKKPSDHAPVIVELE
jgi:exodeoxyribonuclease-3